MANQDQFQATVVAGIETPGSEKAQNTFKALLKIVEQLEGEAKKAGQALVQSFEANKKPEELVAKIKILQRELKFLNTTAAGAKLFKDSYVTSALELNRAIGQAAKAYDAMRQSQAMSRYELGLDSKTAKEASNSLKILEQNIKAVDLALAKDSGNKALIEKKTLLNDNKELLSIITKELQQQTTAQRLQESIDKQNFANQKSRYAEIQKLTQKRREEEKSAAAQTRADNARLDYSDEGRAFADQQSQLRRARISNSLLPGQGDIAQRGISQRAESNYLRSAYQDANLKPQASFAATISDSAKVRQLAMEIRDIERQIVTARMQGNVDLEKEGKLLTDIKGKLTQVSNARSDQNLNDPDRVNSRRDSQARNLANKASGEGAASLIAVQASLMVNYSILNNTVNAMQAAVRTSVELEAAFRNVQAVTGTTRTEMSGLETTIKDVAASSRFTSLQVADAALTLGQAGLSAQQVGTALKSVVMLASAAGTDINQAVDLVTSVVGVFDKTVNDIADIANKVTQAANSSKLSVDKMALGLQYAGNVAAQSGVSFEEVTAAMASMANAGIKSGSTIGTGMRQFLTEMQKPSEEFLGSLKRIGLSISDIDLKSNGLLGVISKLREAGFVASDAIRSFDVRGAAAFNALIADPADLERQYRLLMNTQAAVEANNIQMDSLKAQSQRLTTSLGNLASTGFEPLSKMLANVAGGLATVVQAMSEHNVVMGVAGTVAAGFVAAGTASYMTSMAAGALKLAGATVETSGALRVLSMASKANSMGELFAATSSAASGMVGLTTASTGAAAATTGLTAATTGLRTAFMGLSVVTGVGLAVVALTAGFYAYDYVVNKTEADIDKLKAAVNTSRGAFEEKDAVVKSLTEKIEELNYKESSLKDNQQALTNESLSLASQFGVVGYQADKNNLSFDTMIGKLRTLKTEMSEIRKQNLENTLADNEKLLAAQTRKLQEDVRGANGVGLGSGNTANQLAQLSKLSSASLTSQQRSTLMSASGQIKAGDSTKMGDVAGARLILERLAAEMETKGGDKLQTNLVKDMASALEKVGRSLSEVNQTQADMARNQSILEKDAGYKKFNESGRFGVSGGKSLTFEQALPKSGNLQVMSGAKETEDNPLAAYDAAKELFKKRETEYTRLRKVIKDMTKNQEITSDAAKTYEIEINRRMEGDKNQIVELSNATKSQATLKYNREKRLLDAQLKGAKTKDGKSEIQQKLGELEVAYKTRAITDEFEIKSITEETQAIIDQQKNNFVDRRDPGARRVGAISERSLKVQADAFDSAADEWKAMTKTTQDINALDGLLDKAIEAKIEAKKKRVEALLAKQANEAKEPGFDNTAKLAQKLEMKALIDGENSKINTFATSFVGLLEAAMERLDGVTKAIKEQKRRIDSTKMSGEDRVFDAEESLRDLDVQMALGKNTRNASGIFTRNRTAANGFGASTTFGPRGVTANNMSEGSSQALALADAAGMTADGVSGGVRQTLAQRRAAMVVEVTKIKLEENEKLIKEYGDDTTGIIGNLTTAYKLAQEKVAAIMEKLTGDIDEITRTRLTAELESANKGVTENFRDLRSAKNERKGLRSENQALQITQSSNMQAIPQEASLENILNTLDEVWTKYSETVGNVDIIRTLNEGMTATLATTSGALGNAFSAIASGTKSVKDAFKDMAISVIKSMLDIVAQMVATAALRALLGFGMSMIGGGAGAAAGTPALASGSVVGASAGTGMAVATAATGGLFVKGGIKRMARGGPINGGVPNVDSVPVLAMAGEFMLNKKAVNSVGEDYLHSLNAGAANVASTTSSSSNKAESSGEPNIVNVWVVSPDQKPSSVGPKDIVATISDDITRGGKIKQLIKTVAMGG